MSKRVVTLMLMFLCLAASSYAQQNVPWQNVNQIITVDPGDYILQPGIPQCGDHRDTRVGETVDAVTTLLARSKGWSAALAKTGGALAGQFVTELQEEVARGTSGSIAQFFNDIGVSPRYATCGTVVLVAPEGWHFIDAKGGAVNSGQESLEGTPASICDDPDEPYVKCHVPDAAWMIIRGPKFIVGTFVNWARETRVAVLGGLAVPDNPGQFSQPPSMFGPPTASMFGQPSERFASPTSLSFGSPGSSPGFSNPPAKAQGYFGGGLPMLPKELFGQ
jgi:hypothetical protein